jgi:hypothetical protein
MISPKDFLDPDRPYCSKPTLKLSPSPLMMLKVVMTLKTEAEI